LDLSPIRTARLDLVLLTPDVEEALAAGEPERASSMAGFVLPAAFATDEWLDLIRWKRAQVAREPAFAEWSLRMVVLRSKLLAVGTTNFHGPPGTNDTDTPGAAEIGYSILPNYRSVGIATEAAEAMLDWANQRHGVTHFISGIESTNLPSLRVSEKLGFVPTGECIDGELIFALRRPSFARGE
jgi:RimJ/RimL family protein N-acetyltransferase